ncbi:uncharacterized protein LOC115885904 [Sitophilus oryzae]|uniref:Uncharacterized protein LOC115885904 n=1 Tax=Sitophilus oryzae TaxID=7048 RepID=A0A6J2YBF9_SITOR|nr:uncharacterized protein LOC115885904 [Sitophilus oryzae]
MKICILYCVLVLLFFSFVKSIESLDFQNSDYAGNYPGLQIYKDHAASEEGGDEYQHSNRSSSRKETRLHLDGMEQGSVWVWTRHIAQVVPELGRCIQTCCTPGVNVRLYTFCSVSVQSRVGPSWTRETIAIEWGHTIVITKLHLLYPCRRLMECYHVKIHQRSQLVGVRFNVSTIRL